MVDDDPNEAKLTAYIAEDAGYEPIVFSLLGDLSDLINEVRARSANAAICDHRLRYKSSAGFDGAAAVAELIARQIPAILVTTFPQDADASIRLWRERVPVLLHRDELTAERLSRELDYCRLELGGNSKPERRPHRVLVRIEAITTEGSVSVADAIIPAWNPQVAVRFPIALIPQGIKPHREEDLIGRRFLAHVNIGASQQEDLYLTRFENAPEAPNGD